MLKKTAMFFAALLHLSVAIAADESSGRILPAPALRASAIENAAVQIVGGQVVVGMQLKKRAGLDARLTWEIPPFRWVTMDADDRDPGFSEIDVFADSRRLPLMRVSSAFIGSLDITQQLRASQVDIEHISLGNIGELPNAGPGGIEKTDPVYAYFDDIDGKLFPAWETREAVLADLPPSTQNISYKYTLRPGFFLVADQVDAAADRIAAHCKLNTASRRRLLFSLKTSNLVCLYRLALPLSQGPISLQWQSRRDSGDNYVCTADGDGIVRVRKGEAVRMRAQQVDVRAIAVTKDSQCEQ